MTKIQKLRFDRNLKAKDIAKDLNINATIISTVEGRKVKASDRVRYKLSSFYGVPEEELFSGDRYAI